MISKVYDEKIRAWIGEHREEILQKWMELIRIPSLSGEPEENAPYGKACAEALRRAAGFFAEKGFSVRLEEKYGYGLAQFGDGERTIGLFAHCDVVPTGDGWMYTEPFVPVIRDGLLFGRGASDNKSGVMASLCIMSILKDCGIPVKSSISAFLGTNEESGMADVEAFAAREKMPDLSLVPDSSFPCSLGEKGILRLWAKSPVPLTDVLEFRGGDAFNIVLDEVNVTLSPNAALEEELREKIGNEGAYTLSGDEDGTLHLRVRGIAKHAADPEGSVNASVLAAKLLGSCKALNGTDRAVMADAAALYGDHWGGGLGISHEDEHFGKLSAVNGMAKVESGHLCLSLDVRYGASFGPEELEEKLSAAYGAKGWEIIECNNRPGFRADPDGYVPGMMKKLYRELTGTEKEPFYMAGGTYARYLKNAFAVGTWADDPHRETPMTRLPAGRGSAHQRDEAVDLAGFFQAVRLLTHAVIACDKEQM